MPILDSEQPKKRALYFVTVIIGTGTASLEISVSDSAFVPITNASWSATETIEIPLPECTLKPVLTGDAVIHVDELERRYHD